MITAKDIKALWGQTPLWPDWKHGREWRVPIYPRQWRIAPPEHNLCKPDDVPIVTFRVDPAVHNGTRKKVWLVYGCYGDLKVLCEVAKR